jgi:hypothetical protein
MKPRNPGRWIVLVALGAHVFVPFAAYASAKAGKAFGDVCSVVGKAQTANALPAGLPSQGSNHHASEHCAFCPGGAATAAVMPPAPPTFHTQAQAVVALRVDCVAPATLLLLLPPSRAPPTSA